jgi:hypothetical protein
MRTFLRRTFVVAVNFAIVIGLLSAMEFGIRAIQARRLGPKSMQPSLHGPLDGLAHCARL